MGKGPQDFEVQVSFDDNGGSESDRLLSRKRLRGSEEARSERYTPDWVVYPSFSIITKAHEPAQMLRVTSTGVWPFRRTQGAEDVVDPIDAYTELMASLSLVNLLPYLSAKACLYFYSEVLFVLTLSILRGSLGGDGV